MDSVNLSDSNQHLANYRTTGNSENDSCAENSFISGNVECAEIITMKMNHAKHSYYQWQWMEQWRRRIFPTLAARIKNKLKDNNLRVNQVITVRPSMMQSPCHFKEESEENKPEVKLRQRKYSPTKIDRQLPVTWSWDDPDRWPAPAFGWPPADTNRLTFKLKYNLGKFEIRSSPQWPLWALHQKTRRPSGSWTPAWWPCWPDVQIGRWL